jgi:uncharacterized protein YjbJ (UPF0337 family)/predicted RNA-binding protein with PIN domain
VARWLVDGSNLVGSRPDGWWRDRRGAFAALVTELQDFAARSGDEVAVVFDGKGPERDERSPDVPVHWAPSADDRIVALVAADPDPASRSVVTSDRELAQRVASRGVTTTGAGGFRRRLDTLLGGRTRRNGYGPAVHSDDRGGPAVGDTGPESGAKGATEGVKGKVKEAAGVLSGDDDLEREGEAQQDKAGAQRDVAAKEAEAERARAEAAGGEAEQRANQQ